MTTTVMFPIKKELKRGQARKKGANSPRVPLQKQAWWWRFLINRVIRAENGIDLLWCRHNCDKICKRESVLFLVLVVWASPPRSRVKIFFPLCIV